MSCSSGGVGHGSSGAAIDFQSCATSGRSPHPIVTAASVSASPTITSPPAYAANRSGSGSAGSSSPCAGSSGCGRSAASAASSPSSCDRPAGAAFTARASTAAADGAGAPASSCPSASSSRRSGSRSSNTRKVSRIAERSGSAAWSSSRSMSTGTSSWIVASSFDSRASSAWFVRFSLRFAPEISSIEASTVSRSPNRCSRSEAVLSPIPGTPGMLSEVSPFRP